MHEDRLRLAAQHQLAGGLECEAVPGQGTGCLGDEDGPGRCRREQARRGVDGIAGHRIGGTGRDAEASCHHRASVDADVQRDRAADPNGPAPADLVAAVEHVERGFQGARGVVLVRDRCAEHRHHGVADELLDEAVEARDRLSEALEQRVLERAHVLGVEPFGDRRKAREIGEHDRHLATIGLAIREVRWRRGGCQLPTAARAEGEAG